MGSHISFTFLGGLADRKNLTGSAILITVRQSKRIYRILIDAGLIQCESKKFFQQNRKILEEIDPKKIDYIILTHAHTDHVGRVPFLVHHGFEGRIITTEPTARMLKTMWKDSAKIQSILSRSLSARVPKIKQNQKRDRQRSQMARGNYDKKKEKRKQERIQEKNDYSPLYGLEDVPKSEELIKNDGYGYEEWYRLTRNISFKFYSSGHVLGGAVCLVKIKRSKKEDLTLGFSGDLGRSDGIILPPPKVPHEKIDYWFVESTYGDRVHPEREHEIQRLLSLVRQAEVNNQRIIIPSFALERTQEIIYLLSYYMQVKEIPMVPIYLDSPMAKDLTTVFSEYWDDEDMFSDKAQSYFNPFNPDKNIYLNIITEHQESNHFCETYNRAAIIIAGSGMCEAGRIRNYLKKDLSNPNATVCLVGYMSEGTLGRKLKDGTPIVKMNDKEVLVKAKVENFDSFSAHADQEFLVQYTKEIVDRYHENGTDEMKQTIFLMHGEDQSANVLRNELFRAFPRKGITDCIQIPSQNKVFVVDED